MQFYLVSCRVSECPLWLSLFVLYYPFSTFIFISPHYLCVCVSVCVCLCWSARKRCQFLAVFFFFFMSCCLAFNAFYLLYFLAIRLWTFVLVRNSSCLSIPLSFSLSHSALLCRVALWGELSYLCVLVCVCVCA